MPDSLQIALKNDSDSSNLHAYITGIAIQQGGQRCILKANGKDLYFPQNPPAIGSPLTEDCAIPLGAPGNTTTVTIPQIAGGRIWIAEDHLTFLLNPGPALVEPSVLNPSDPNASVDFGFCEFTLNHELYANISYVDFVPRIPIALSLQQASGQTQHVAGMAPDGLAQLAQLLHAQAQTDHQPWDKLVVRAAGRPLRILNATHGAAVGADFAGYFEPHIDAVWAKYGGGARLRIDTQAGAGVLEGRVNGAGALVVGDEAFGKPSTADVLGCNSGPFATGASPTRNAIIPRLAAGFARSTLLECAEQPAPPHAFYRTERANHYARLVHAVNVDGKGYAFAYDDVQPEGGEDQSGKVNAGDPVLFTVTVGGKSAGAQRGERGGMGEHGHGGEYRRAPPVPPRSTRPDQGAHHGGGLGEKVRGLADRFAKK
nr:glucan endo-1,3-beta-glucosidase [Quercus suber]